MEYNLKGVIDLIPLEIRKKTPGIGKVVSLILSLIVSLKDGDRISIPGITMEKYLDNLLVIDSKVSPMDMLKTFEENNLLGGNDKRLMS